MLEGEDYRCKRLYGITSVEERQKQFFPSYWRNDKTGTWDIAFLDKFVIYDCKFWEYKEKYVSEDQEGVHSFVVTNGNKELRINVGKNKNGKRSIWIGVNKGNYSMITSRYLPDYPKKDSRTSFVDNGDKLEPVTIVGLVDDIPHWMSLKDKMKISHYGLYDENEIHEETKIDSLGRFSITFPLHNSGEVFVGWGSLYYRTMLEPGKTYFMLFDHKEGHRLVMGEDAQLQNELMKYRLDFDCYRYDEYHNKAHDHELDDRYIALVDSFMNKKFTTLDNLHKAHPMLSERFMKYMKGNTISQQANHIEEARIYANAKSKKDKLLDYEFDNVYNKIDKPFIVHRDTKSFLYNFLYTLLGMSFKDDICVSSKDAAFDLAENDADKKALLALDELRDSCEAIGNSDMDSLQKINLISEIYEKNQDLIIAVKEFEKKTRLQDYCPAKLNMISIDGILSIIDSLKLDKSLGDFFIYGKANDRMNQDHKPLHEKYMAYLKSHLENQELMDSIISRNNFYKALEEETMSLERFGSNVDLSNVTEGKEIMEKILEPFKGKVVILDVWGTWCSPCKELLSHSQDEYRRLSPYNVVFLYLANNSPMDNWKNIITEYKAYGDNVVHYNLDALKQLKVEKFLQVTHYPFFVYYDKEGKQVETKTKITPRNMDELEELIKSLDK